MFTPGNKLSWGNRGGGRLPGSTKSVQVELGLKEALPFIKENNLVIKSLNVLNKFLSNEPQTVLERRLQLDCAKYVIDKVIPDLRYLESETENNLDMSNSLKKLLEDIQGRISGLHDSAKATDIQANKSNGHE